MLTILWHDVESAGYTDHIKLEWLVNEGNCQAATHLITGPRSGRHQAKCDIQVHDRVAEFDYEPYREFNETNGMFLGVLRLQFSDPMRQNVSQVLWKDIGAERFAPCSTTVTFIPDAPTEFEALLAKAMQLSSTERQKRLASANRKPARVQVVSTVFLRNQYVVAEVLARAAGKCEHCKKSAPFTRAKDGTPYLEVHHRVRLAKDGDDTVENAEALCPNCHRQAHYG